MPARPSPHVLSFRPTNGRGSAFRPSDHAWRRHPQSRCPRREGVLFPAKTTICQTSPLRSGARTSMLKQACT